MSASDRKAASARDRASSNKGVAEPEATAAPERPKYVPPLTKEQQEKLAAKKARIKKQKRLAAEAAKREEDRLAEERRLIEEAANERWRNCLKCLADSVPQLLANPWLIVQEAKFIHDYLDSLTETLANLSKHEDDIDLVRTVLQDVYETFVDLGRFARCQPAFFITHPATIKRFVRLLEQVAHRGSDKALFPNVLSLLGPTLAREELYDLLADVRIVNSLLSFARTDWIPTPSTLALLLQVYEMLSCSPRMRQMFMEDTGFDKLMKLAYGYVPGFSKEQQIAAQYGKLRDPCHHFYEE